MRDENFNKETSSESYMNMRECPSCGLLSLSGMSGGKDAVCANCGYKDPCCYD